MSLHSESREKARFNSENSEFSKLIWINCLFVCLKKLVSVVLVLFFFVVQIPFYSTLICSFRSTSIGYSNKCDSFILYLLWLISFIFFPVVVVVVDVFSIHFDFKSPIDQPKKTKNKHSKQNNPNFLSSWSFLLLIYNCISVWQSDRWP